MIDIVDAKVQALQDLVETLNSFINDIESVSSASGIYVFDYEATSGGIPGLQDALYDGLDFSASTLASKMGSH